MAEHNPPRETTSASATNHAPAVQTDEVCAREAACCGMRGSGRVVGLCCMESGQCGVIREMATAGADGAYLRALGLRPNRRIRLCRANGPWIVEVGCHRGPASRIGLARSLAEQVQVEVNEHPDGTPAAEAE